MADLSQSSYQKIAQRAYGSGGTGGGGSSGGGSSHKGVDVYTLDQYGNPVKQSPEAIFTDLKTGEVTKTKLTPQVKGYIEQMRQSGLAERQTTEYNKILVENARKAGYNARISEDLQSVTLFGRGIKPTIYYGGGAYGESGKNVGTTKYEPRLFSNIKQPKVTISELDRKSVV